MTKITTINSDTIIALAQKDLDAYNKKEKSYQLLNWLKDELILLEIEKKNKVYMNIKAFNKSLNILALFRERNLTELKCDICDRTTVNITFKFDLTTLNNAERRRLNQTYGLTLEEMTEEEVDETYAHLC